MSKNQKLSCHGSNQGAKSTKYRIGGDTNIKVSGGGSGSCPSSDDIGTVRIFSGETFTTFAPWDVIDGDTSRRDGAFYKLVKEAFAISSYVEGQNLKFFSSPYSQIQESTGTPGPLIRNASNTARVHAATTYAVSPDRLLMGQKFSIPVRDGNVQAVFVRLQGSSASLTSGVTVGYINNFAFAPVDIAKIMNAQNISSYNTVGVPSGLAGGAFSTMEQVLNAGDADVFIYFAGVNLEGNLELVSETEYDTDILDYALMVNGAEEFADDIVETYNAGFRILVQNGRYDQILNDAGIGSANRWTPTTVPM